MSSGGKGIGEDTMTDEQQAQRALTGKVEVFVGDVHKIIHNDKLVIARITKITGDHIFFDYSNKPDRLWGRHLLPFDHYCNHAEFIGKLRRADRYQQRESVVLDLSEPTQLQSQTSAAFQQYISQIAQFQTQQAQQRSQLSQLGQYQQGKIGGGINV